MNERKEKHSVLPLVTIFQRGRGGLKGGRGDSQSGPAAFPTFTSSDGEVEIGASYPVLEALKPILCVIARDGLKG